MIGQQAPDFELPTADGKRVRLSEVYAKGPVVLYFYPKDETAGCTAEACAFRDSYEDFKSAGAEVIGVSNDDGSAHQKFADKHRLPFLLLSDDRGQVAAKFNVKRAAFGMLPGRETFVIDRQGVVQHHFVSLLRATQHVKEAIEVVKRFA